MSVLKNLFDASKKYESSVKDDYKRVVSYDADGKEFITYEKEDYAKFQKSLGSVSDWSLQALLKAGIDPAFPIHTGLNTRLDGVGVVSDAEAIADAILNDMNTQNNEG